MISCLLIHISRNRDGEPVSREDRLAGETLRIGRASACEIHLADQRVCRILATVQRYEDGRLQIIAEADETLRVDGQSRQHAVLSPGTRIEIDPYVLLVEPESDGHDLVLSLEMTQPLPDPEIAPLSLASLPWSKRQLGFRLAAGTLLLFFLLPLLASLSQPFGQWLSRLPIALTAWWNPGPLSGGHALIGNHCSTCHSQAFQAIADDTCLECHQKMRRHLATPNCHIDHKGKSGLVSSNAAQCAPCHGAIEKIHPKTSLTDIHDFDTDHPPFRITLPLKNSLVRVKQEELHRHQAEQGIKMSHKIHLDKKGVSSPLGNVVMACQDCHKPDESGQHFLPMSMKESCQQSRCHRIYFQEPVEGRVPHGSVRELMHTAREFYLKWLTNPSTDFVTACGKREEEAASRVNQTLDCANRLAQQNIAVLFKKNLNCDMCHETEPTGDADLPWKIAPVRIHRDWQPGAIFMHSKHDTVNCTECHDKSNARTSTEISMPGLEKCRKCHTGDHAVAGKIRTGCGDCHRFHSKAVISKE
ncbi:MAG: hypothetical protein H7834_05305 [Magnetococcus sp. YQC-9]